MCQSYQKLRPLFSIVHDNYGGYRLLYNGKAVVSPYVFKRNPVGFVAPIPDGVVTELSVMRSERTGQQLLLLGPIRFVNCDSEPNCEFEFEFFEINACLCRTCRFQKLEQNAAEVFESLLEGCIYETTDEVVLELEEHIVTNSLPSMPKKRKVRGSALIERVNELTSSPLSNDGSPSLSSRFRFVPTVESNFQNYNSSSEYLSSDSSFSEEASTTRELTNEKTEVSIESGQEGFESPEETPFLTGNDFISSIDESQNVDVHLESYEVSEIEEEDFSNANPDLFE